jgi:hypothetical protein
MSSTYTNQPMGMVHVNGVARRLTFHVCAAPARPWSPISPLSAIDTNDGKPGRLRRTWLSTT